MTVIDLDKPEPSWPSCLWLPPGRDQVRSLIATLCARLLLCTDCAGCLDNILPRCIWSARSEPESGGSRRHFAMWHLEY